MDIEQRWYTGVRCDKKGCGVEWTGKADDALFNRNHRRDAQAVGWTAWAGARTRRDYCPDHRPSAGAQMWMVNEP